MNRLTNKNLTENENFVKQNFQDRESAHSMTHHGDPPIDPTRGEDPGLSSLSSRFPPSQWTDLRVRSGLTPETISASKIYAVRPYNLEKILGPYLAKKVDSAMAIPYDHGSDFVRYKLFSDNPITDKHGHKVKYHQPKDSRPALCIPPETKGLDDTNTPLWILEGEKKTLRWWQEGLNVVLESLVHGIGVTCTLCILS